MNKIKELPKIQKKKKIDASFDQLAKKVRKIFEEEAHYLKTKTENYGPNKTGKFTLSS